MMPLPPEVRDWQRHGNSESFPTWVARGRTAKVLGSPEPLRLLASLGVAGAGHRGIVTGARSEPFLQRDEFAVRSEATWTVAFRPPA